MRREQGDERVLAVAGDEEGVVGGEEGYEGLEAVGGAGFGVVRIVDARGAGRCGEVGVGCLGRGGKIECGCG